MSWEKEEAKSRHVDFACPVVKSKSNPSLLASASSDPQQIPSAAVIIPAAQHSPPLPPAAVNAAPVASVSRAPLPFEPYPHNPPPSGEWINYDCIGGTQDTRFCGTQVNLYGILSHVFILLTTISNLISSCCLSTGFVLYLSDSFTPPFFFILDWTWFHYLLSC